MDSQAHIGFQIPETLYQDVTGLIEQIRTRPQQRQHGKAAADVVSALMHQGIQTFYFDVVNGVRTHPAARKSADAGISTVAKGADLVIRKMANSLEPDELVIIANYLSGLLFVQGDQRYLAFPLEPASVQELQQVIARIHSDVDTFAYNHLIANALCRLTDQAVQHFYYQPTRLIKIRTFVKKSADLGIRTVLKGIHFVIHLLFRQTRQRELIRFSAILESQLVYLPATR